MTKEQILFCTYIIVWLIIGSFGILNSKKARIVWEMIIFVLGFLMIPFIAMFCKLI